MILLVTVKLQAQQPELIDTWYLQNLIIDGNDNIPPSDTEVPYVYAVFTPTAFGTFVCAGIVGTVAYNDDNNSFNLTASMTANDCSIFQENTDFQNLYLGVFYFGRTSPFFYAIEELGNESKQLTVTNELGDQAIYTSSTLAVQEFSRTTIIVYPNPVKDILFISVNENFQDLNFIVYDLYGKEVIKTSNDTIDMSGLTSGLYYLAVTNQNGNVVVKKFIKH